MRWILVCNYYYIIGVIYEINNMLKKKKMRHILDLKFHNSLLFLLV